MDWSKNFSALVEHLRLKKVQITAYHPQSNVFIDFLVQIFPVLFGKCPN